MFTLWLVVVVILNLITSLVLAWACILLWRSTRHWPYIMFFIIFILQLSKILLLNIYRNIVLWKSTIEEVGRFNKSFAPFQAGVSSLVMTVCLILALIAGIGIVIVYSNYNKEEKH